MHPAVRRFGYAAGGAAAFVVAGRFLWRRNRFDLRDKHALVTGGSRGLGLALARRLVEEGCRVAICARDEAELERARQDLAARGGAVMVFACDVSDRNQVERFVAAARERFGPIDLLINNAGLIQVGPVDAFTHEDFANAMGVMFWGVLHPTLAALPEMLARKSGHIVNITSIGGKIAVPHLLPYTCAKFAAVGFSEGLRAEVKSRGVEVLTVAPGLMRTGSYVNAIFKGKNEQEAAWFSVSASAPFVSIAAGRAAAKIVAAIRRGDAERILTPQASIAARLHGLFPGLTTNALAVINRMLPAPSENHGERRGTEIPSLHMGALSYLTALGRLSGKRMNQPVPAK
jgi:NAD(P)-dependent dehydrogenase (short-subunit alcohol dehydrogenase family)